MVLLVWVNIGDRRQGGEAEGIAASGEILEGKQGSGEQGSGEGSEEEKDTWMVKIYKEMEQKSKEEVKDPALENGSRIFELDESDPVVQRLMGLVRQVRTGVLLLLS